MAVYVDNARIKFGRMIMCHMMADTLEELHAVAARIGMRREWFQPISSPHYDVSLERRAAAIRAGALPVTSRDLVPLIRMYRAQREAEARPKEVVRLVRRNKIW